MRRAASILLTVFSAAALGQAPAAAPRPAERFQLPQGPVTVTADRAEWEQAGTMLYTGNVRLVSEGLEMQGDRMELHQRAEGHFQARITGAPARLLHEATAGTQPLAAQANSLSYDSQKAVAELVGRAQIERGPDRLTGEKIVYDVAARRLQAAGGAGQQVRIVIQPPPPPEAPQQ